MISTQVPDGITLRILLSKLLSSRSSSVAVPGLVGGAPAQGWGPVGGRDTARARAASFMIACLRQTPRTVCNARPFDRLVARLPAVRSGARAGRTPAAVQLALCSKHQNSLPIVPIKQSSRPP